MLWDVLLLLHFDEVKSSLIIFLVRAYGREVTLLMTIKALDILVVSLIVSHLASLPLLGSEA